MKTFEEWKEQVNSGHLCGPCKREDPEDYKEKCECCGTLLLEQRRSCDSVFGIITTDAAPLECVWDESRKEPIEMLKKAMKFIDEECRRHHSYASDFNCPGDWNEEECRCPAKAHNKALDELLAEIKEFTNEEI